MTVTVGTSAGGSEFLLVEQSGQIERWAGVLTAQPSASATIFGCVDAVNGAGLVTRVCHDITWDLTPPVMYDMWLFHTGFEQYMRPWCHNGCYGHADESVCDSPMPECYGNNIEAYSNSSTVFSFQITLGDEPQAANTLMGRVLFAISDKFLQEPDGTFFDLGHGEKLDAVRGMSQSDVRAYERRLTIRASGLQLQHNTLYWVHIWACDKVGNCGMTIGYPFRTDLTPPVLPPKIYPDVSVPQTDYWMWRDAINVAWMDATPCYTKEGGSCGWDVSESDGGWRPGSPVPDPETGPSVRHCPSNRGH